MSQTIWAHRLSLKAFNTGGQALQLPLLTALFKAYFEEKKDIGDINLLADISEEVGVMTKGEVCPGKLTYATTSRTYFCVIHVGH